MGPRFQIAAKIASIVPTDRPEESSVIIRRLACLSALVFPLSALAVPPRADHVVLVIEENRSFQVIMAAKDTPYIHELAAEGALFTQSFAITHPSEPNYLALFAGETE